MKPDRNNLQRTVVKANVTGPRMYLMDRGQ